MYAVARRAVLCVGQLFYQNRKMKELLKESYRLSLRKESDGDMKDGQNARMRDSERHALLLMVSGSRVVIHKQKSLHIRNSLIQYYIFLLNMLFNMSYNMNKNTKLIQNINKQ
jgi:hypothetical protein